MSKKHFKALACAIAKISKDTEREDTAYRIGEVCASLNPLFSWDKWLTACNVSLSTKVC